MHAHTHAQTCTSKLWHHFTKFHRNCSYELQFCPRTCRSSGFLEAQIIRGSRWFWALKNFLKNILLQSILGIIFYTHMGFVGTLRHHRSHITYCLLCVCVCVCVHRTKIFSWKVFSPSTAHPEPSQNQTRDCFYLWFCFTMLWLNVLSY